MHWPKCLRVLVHKVDDYRSLLQLAGKRKFTQCYCLLLLNFCSFFELWRAINYAISDIAWRTIFAVQRQQQSRLCFRHRILFFSERAMKPCDDSGIEKKDDWSAVISPDFIINTAVSLDSCEESEKIFTFYFFYFRVMHFAIVELFHLFIFNVELNYFASARAFMRTINFTLPRKKLKWIIFRLHFFPRHIMKILLSVSSARRL